MDRRNFLKATASGIAATLGSELDGGEGAKDPVPRRDLGRTGEKLSIIGFGGIVAMGAGQDGANRIVREAFDAGVNYFDVAPSYGDGEAEERLGPALEGLRDKVFLACKTGRRDRDGAREELERSLRRLRTDRFDLYQLHALTSKEDVEKALGPGGAVEAFVEARKKGQVRFLGFSAHSVEAALAAIRGFDFDTVLFPINWVCYARGDFGPQVLRAAREKGMGCLALKAMARAPWPKDAKREYPKCWYQPVAGEEEAGLALRFTLSEPVTAAIPPGDERLFRLALSLARTFRPLSEDERKKILERAAGIEPIFAHARPAGAAAGDWAPLFDGKSLDGWKRLNGTAKYEVEGNAIVGTTVEGSPNSFLCTERNYGDFELGFDVKLDPRLNSGVQIRSQSLPEYQSGRVHGYQVEIAADGGSGYIYDEARRGWLSKDRSDPRAREAFRKDGWNRYRVLCKGDSIKTWVNGVPVADLTDSMTRSGFIGLQVHSFGGDRPAQVRWRNLFLKELGPEKAEEAAKPAGDPAQAVIDEVEKECLTRPVYMLGRARASRLAELVRRAKPRLAVEFGTAVGYSGLWIARELKALGSGRLVTIEIDPARVKEAEENFRRAGVADFVSVKLGDARKLVREIEGPVDFAFIDCDFGNYEPVLDGLEGKLRDGAVLVADNVLIGAGPMAGYLERLRSRYPSRSEWFEKDLPWCDIDAMEVTEIRR